jgi:hypothetical protein
MLSLQAFGQLMTELTKIAFLVDITPNDYVVKLLHESFGFGYSFVLWHSKPS